MKKLLIAAVAGICLASCDNSEKFHIEGHITDAADSMLVFEAMTLEGITPLDSVKLKSDGAFSFSAARPDCPEFYCLRIGDKRVSVAVDSTETITLTASLTTLPEKYKVEGSVGSQKIQEIALMQQKLYDQIIAVTSNESMYPGDITDSVNSLVIAYKEKTKNDYIFKDPSSSYAYYAVHQSVGPYQLFNPSSDRDDVKCYAAVATAWDGSYPDAARTQQLCNLAIKGMQNTASPQQKVIELDSDKIKETSIVNISLPDANGNIHSLTDLKGKVVVLDFTMYSARESAERTRIMRTLYDRYHAQGLEIYQVSLDEDAHYWKTACEPLPWICVHETDGRATSSYGVANLPATFIINRDNAIQLRLDANTVLENEIKKLL